MSGKTLKAMCVLMKTIMYILIAEATVAVVLGKHTLFMYTGLVLLILSPILVLVRTRCRTVQMGK